MNLAARLAPEPADERCTLHSRPEIVALLRGVAEARCLARVHFGHGESIATHLLHIDPDSGTLTFDAAADQQANERLLGSSPLAVVAWLDGVKLQFGAKRADPARYEDLPAFSMRLPAELLRLQRREHYRVQPPALRPLWLKLRHPRAPGAVIELRVLDISCGGIALEMPEDAPALAVGSVLRDCRIELPGYGALTATLEIRAIAPPAASGARRCARYGCRYVRLPGQAEPIIQRYVLELERARRPAARRPV